ncbi:MAG: formate dehydrogenase subunit delta [Dermatophilaceae bacterium]
MSAPTGPAAVVRLANDIARQFAHLPAAEAAEHVATHLTKFWERRMLTDLVMRTRAGEDELDPLVVTAVHDVVTHHVDEAELAEPSGG